MKDTVQYSEWHGGFLAFRNGSALKNIRRQVRIFRTEEEARKALKKSKGLYFGAR